MKRPASQNKRVSFMSGFPGSKSIRDFRETGPWSESENAEEIANTLCSFMPFPRVVHASHHHVSLPKAWDLVKVLLFCRRFSKAPDKISLKVPSFAFLFLHSIHHRGFAPLPNLKYLDFLDCFFNVESAYEHIFGYFPISLL